MTVDPIQKWTVIEEEDVSPSKWFPLVRHTVALPGGMVIDDYYLAPLGDVVIAMAITPQNEVVMVRQYKHGLGEILFELPGGMQQTGKSIEESALAELEEETGIKAEASQLIPLGKIANNPTKTCSVTYGFLVFNAEFNSVQKPDPTENIEVHLMPAPEVLKKALNGEIYVTDTLNYIFKAAHLYPQLFGVGQ